MAKEYIEREALLREFGEEPYVWHDDDAEEMQERNDWNTYTNIVKAAPAADVAEVVHGSWIPLRESEITGWNPGFAGHDPIGGYKCSNCNKEAVFDCNDSFVLSDYCPNCGAKMDGGVKDAAD